MKPQFFKIAVTLLCVSTLVSLGCEKTSSTQGSEQDEAVQRVLHPQSLGTWQFKSSKDKAQDWGTEHSGTYTNDGAELKVVINEANVDNPPAWDALFVAPEDFAGNPAMLDTRDDKETFMVRVGKRWRVDFKTKNPGTVDLKDVAKSYNYSALN